MPICTILVGLPGAGKTTWRAAHAADAAVISTDDLIDDFAAHLGITYSDAFRQADLKAFERQALADFVEAIRNRQDIIVDRTNLSLKSRARFLPQLPAEYEKRAIIFDPPEDVLHERLATRAEQTGKFIPEHVIDAMRKSYQAPSAEEGFDAVVNFHPNED